MLSRKNKQTSLICFKIALILLARCSVNAELMTDVNVGYTSSFIGLQM